MKRSRTSPPNRVGRIQIFSFLAALLMLLAVIPSAEAAPSAPGLILGTESAFKATANTDEAETVWYGGTPWRIIGYDGEGNSYTESSGKMTLFSVELLSEHVHFKVDEDYQERGDYVTPTYYKGSELESVVNGLYETLFTPSEKEAVAERVLRVQDFVENPPYSNGIAGEETNAFLWPLSQRKPTRCHRTHSAELILGMETASGGCVLQGCLFILRWEKVLVRQLQHSFWRAAMFFTWGMMCRMVAKSVLL